MRQAWVVMLRWLGNNPKAREETRITTEEEEWIFDFHSIFKSKAEHLNFCVGGGGGGGRIWKAENRCWWSRFYSSKALQPAKAAAAQSACRLSLQLSRTLRIVTEVEEQRHWIIINHPHSFAWTSTSTSSASSNPESWDIFTLNWTLRAWPNNPRNIK